MKIGLNLLFLLPGETGGIRTYAYGIIRELAQLDATNTYYLFLNQESRDLFSDLPANFIRVICKFNAAARWKRYGWEQFVLPWQILMREIDVFHSLAYVGPLAAPCSSIVTAHDVNFLGWGRSMPWTRRVLLGVITTLLCHRSRYIVTVSEFSAGEISKQLKVPRKRIVVIPNAVRNDCWPTVTRTRPLDGHYIVAYANGDQNKNIDMLVQAFARIPGDVLLVLIGKVPDYVRAALATLPPNVKSRIKCAGYLTDEEVRQYLLHAELLAFPSLYEGFGIPILEANAAGVAIACSVAGALPEVAANSALFFRPSSVIEMAEKMEKLLKDKELRMTLIANGKRNLERFSWRKSAASILNLYRASCPSRDARRDVLLGQE